MSGGRWIEIEVERVLEIDRGKDVILSDRSGFAGAHTILVQLSEGAQQALVRDLTAETHNGQ